LRSDEAEMRCGCAGPAHRHAERVVEHGIGDGLAAVGYAPRAAQRIAVVELAGRTGSLANAGRVDRASVFEHRAGRCGTGRTQLLK
jgi:hypothetical protein